jgi:hypothetical protein
MRGGLRYLLKILFDPFTFRFKFPTDNDLARVEPSAKRAAEWREASAVESGMLPSQSLSSPGPIV